MQYKIDSGIPLPPRGGDFDLEVHLASMRIANGDPSDQSILDPIKRSASIWRDKAAKLGIRVKLVRQPCGHYRVWRIA